VLAPPTVVFAAAAVTVLAAWDAVLVVLAAAAETVPETVVAASEITGAAAFAVPETAENSGPPRPAEGWVAAEAGAASSTAMPNARHRPLIAAPKAHKSTFRTGTHQPLMPGTLVT
jgi:hypothetical protein